MPCQSWIDRGMTTTCATTLQLVQFAGEMHPLVLGASCLRGFSIQFSELIGVSFSLEYSGVYVFNRMFASVRYVFALVFDAYLCDLHWDAELSENHTHGK